MGLMDKMKDAASQALLQTQQGLEKAKGDFAASRADDSFTAGAAAALPSESQEPRPIVELVSHIEGKNAKVRLWPDRIDYEKPRGMSAGKLTAGVFTGGASLLVTGIKGGNDEHETVLLKHVTNVSSRKDGIMYYAVDVQTSAGAVVNTVAFRVNRDEAAHFRTAILAAMQQLDAPSGAPIIIQQAAATASPAATPDLTGQLLQLASLRDAGVLTEDEFAAKKADILARM